MEKIIRKYLLDIFLENSSLLATYMGEPAVFNTKVPDDVNEEYEEEESYWKDDIQYPRCVFELSMQADTERSVSGRLLIDVMAENNEFQQHEPLASILKDAVDGCFFSNTDLTISAQWDRSDVFAEDDDKVVGITLSFDILAYPNQQTQSPDPIVAMNTWLKTLYQKAYVIGLDTLPEVWKPTNDSPALYCRLAKLGNSSRMNSTACVTWIGADIYMNVMTPDESTRSTLCMTIHSMLNHASRIILDDDSPMLIDNVTTNLTSDPLRDGQLYIKTTYGVLPQSIQKPRLNRATIHGLHVESEVQHGK